MNVSTPESPKTDPGTGCSNYLPKLGPIHPGGGGGGTPTIFSWGPCAAGTLRTLATENEGHFLLTLAYTRPC